MVPWCSDVFRLLIFKDLIKSLTLLLFIVISTWCAAWYYLFSYFPHSALTHKSDIITIELPPGSSVKAMTKQLELSGILNRFQSHLFCWWSQLKGTQCLLQAGVYVINFDITPEELMEKFIKGDIAQYALTLREGDTISDILAMLAKHPAIKKDLTDKSHSDLMDILGEPHLFAEGLFFPDTYYFSANTSDVAFLRRARQTMEARLQEAWENRDPTTFLKTPYEALILASIIEKETSNDKERFIISGVFHRRIEKNMRLQADPTVVYGIKEFTKPITKEHLKFDSPYNTYRYKGLPPTPIGLPGIQSIIAAMHPEKGDALYFVSNGDGTHQFSTTLEEHNEAVAKYRRSVKL